MDHSQLSRSDLESLIRKLDHEYHELGKTSVSDDDYDQIREMYEKKYGQWTQIGHPVDTSKSSKTTTLPFYMASMNKLKNDALDRWIIKHPGPYVVSDKLDGVSALYHEDKLYTRGNGRVGRDISSLLAHINLPKLTKGITVRGELVISKLNFNALVDDGILTHRSIPRNTVAGCVNAVKPNHEILPRIDFVAFEIVHPRIPATDQIVQMRNSGFNVAHSLFVDCLDDLSGILIDRKRSSQYEIDGIVIEDSSKTHNLKVDSNPSHAFAFKMQSAFTQATVKGVQWNISKDKLAKPTVLLEPVHLDGIRIAKTTGFNGKFIVDNDIGPGTVLEITRSGDVIPHIKRILRSTTAQLPNFKYRMTKNGVDMEVIDESDDVLITIALKQFQNTVEKLQIKGLKSATVKALFEAGIKSVKDLFNLDAASLRSLRLNGFKEAKISNIISEIRSAKENLSCLKLMVASNAFGKGFSSSKLSSIANAIDVDITEADVTVDDILTVDGIGLLSAAQFVEKLPAFKKFIHDNCLQSFCTVVAHDESCSRNVEGPLSGLTFCFSGGTVPEAENIIENNGGSIVKTFSRTCSHLIVIDKARSTSKTMKAARYGIPIIDLQDLKNMSSTNGNV